eukprot:gene17063-23473_t
MVILTVLMARPVTHTSTEKHELEFMQQALKTGTDKIMYGLFLVPLSHKAKETRNKIKFLEIGLGCDSGLTGDSGDTSLWIHLFGSENIDLWIAEYDAACATKYAKNHKECNVMIGDQSNIQDLNKWKNQSGGNFDIIVDDGGHKNDQVLNSFYSLWPTVNPGGIYFIEDLQTSRNKNYLSPGLDFSVIDVIQTWMDELTTVGYLELKDAGFEGVPRKKEIDALRLKHPLPKGLKWIFCQSQ